jgi:hypothetical protein
MDSNTGKPQGSAAPKLATMRQLIACGVALGIMALGAWSLMGQNAPYHPEAYTDDVTRTDTIITD